MAATTTCHGCVNAARKLRGITPRLICKRYHQPALARCLDYQRKPDAIAAALNFLKTAAGK